MLYYSPIDGNILTECIKYYPKTCFVMTQLGDKLSDNLKSMIKEIESHLKLREFKFIDANTCITGDDFLEKIWKMAISCPIGIAVIDENMEQKTISNIFYELGLFDSLGKETVIIKSKDFKIPSDFVRTEYIKYDENFAGQFDKFIDNVISRGEFYGTMSEQFEAKPLLTIDYLRRAYLISQDTSYQQKAKTIMEANNLDEHTKMILYGFINHT